jgi:hypothetical protein
MNAELSLPPRWAQRVLESTLMARDQETIAGDLLEEYRERIGQGHGVRSVDVWYAKQVASLMWIAALPGPVLLAAAVFTRFLSIAWPATEFGQRVIMILAATGATYFLAGAYGGWLTRRVRAGTAIVVTAITVVLLVNPAATLVHATLWRDPPTSSALRISGGYFALVMFPAFPLGLLVAIGGAAFARLLSSRKDLASRTRTVRSITES